MASAKLPACILLLGLWMAGRSVADEPSLQEALDGWNSSIEEIRSYDVTLRTSHLVVDHPTGKASLAGRLVCRHRFLHGMWRVDRLRVESFRSQSPPEIGETPSGAVWAIAWDGKTLRSYDSEQKIATLLRLPQVNAWGTLGGPLYHELYRATSFLGEPYPRNLQARGPARLILQDDLLRIEAPARPEASVSWNTMELWVELSRSRGLMPVRIVRRDPAPEGGAEVELVCRYRRWPPGIWAPERAEQISRLRSGAAVQTLATVEIEVTQAQFNVPLDPALFALEVPPGTVVYDGQERRNFLAAEGGKRDYEGYRRLMAQRLPASPSRGILGGDALRTGLIVLHLAAIVLLASYFIYRRLKVSHDPGTRGSL